MSERQAPPEGIAGSALRGPFAVGRYAAELRDFLRGRTRVQLFGEVWNLRTSRTKLYFELRDADGALLLAVGGAAGFALATTTRHPVDEVVPNRA